MEPSYVNVHSVMKIALIVVAVLVVAAAALVLYLFRPLRTKPIPAEFECYDLGQGAYVPLDTPTQSFGVGLSYAAHIAETASRFDPNGKPPVFEKRPSTMVRTNAEVHLPTPDELVATADALEPGLGDSLRSEFPSLSALLDYEVEMGFVLLEDVDPSQLKDPGFAPRLGFFIANDVSARSVQILGEGRTNRFDYWGAAKSFAGFMPLAERAWVPSEAKPNGIPCVEIETLVNGKVRQRQSTDNLIYTPADMLGFVHSEFPNAQLTAGTVVLTGTPGGVAMTTPRWLARLAGLLGMDRFKKLSAKLGGDTSRFLKVGDVVTVRGQGLGEVTVTIAP
jgi:2-keto-4-pentenoate hydratase/2-oxohepta-3-ene-1,7-dioic acid hydratase in catechol pathway